MLKIKGNKCGVNRPEKKTTKEEAEADDEAYSRWLRRRKGSNRPEKKTMEAEAEATLLELRESEDGGGRRSFGEDRGGRRRSLFLNWKGITNLQRDG